MAGRPTFLTDEIAKAIIEDVRNGVAPDTAAAKHGVIRRNFNNWMQWARSQILLEEETPFTRLLEGIEQARADWISSVIARGKSIMMTGQYVSVKDVMLWLERDDPDHYRKRETTEVIGRIDSRQTVEHLTTPQQDAERAGRMLAILEQQGIVPLLRENEELVDVEIVDRGNSGRTDESVDERSLDDAGDGEIEVDGNLESEVDAVHSTPPVAEASNIS